MSVQNRRILESARKTRILRRNSRPRSSFEIGPKESRIEATDRKTKLSHPRRPFRFFSSSVSSEKIFIVSINHFVRLCF